MIDNGDGKGFLEELYLSGFDQGRFEELYGNGSDPRAAEIIGRYHALIRDYPPAKLEKEGSLPPELLDGLTGSDCGRVRRPAQGSLLSQPDRASVPRKRSPRLGRPLLRKVPIFAFLVHFGSDGLSESCARLIETCSGIGHTLGLYPSTASARVGPSLASPLSRSGEPRI